MIQPLDIFKHVKNLWSKNQVLLSKIQISLKMIAVQATERVKTFLTNFFLMCNALMHIDAA